MLRRAELRKLGGYVANWAMVLANLHAASVLVDSCRVPGPSESIDDGLYDLFLLCVLPHWGDAEQNVINALTGKLGNCLLTAGLAQCGQSCASKIVVSVSESSAAPICQAVGLCWPASTPGASTGCRSGFGETFVHQNVNVATDSCSG